MTRGSDSPIAERHADDATRDARAAALLQTILAQVPDLVVVKDHEGRYLLANAAAERVFGRTEAEIVGRTDADLFPPALAAALHGVDEAVMRSGATQIIEEIVPSAAAGGEERIFTTVKSPLRGPDGRVVGVVVTARDETERRRMEDALRTREAEFRAMADHIPQLAWMADPTGAIFWYNRRWYDYTATSFEEMRGWGWRAVHHPEHVARVEEHFRRAVAAGEPWEDTFPLRGGDGRFRWFLSRALPIRGEDGQIVRWFGTNTDVTELREAEAARDRALAEAEGARRRAEEANRAKSDFLAAMSHELRTPLNAIGGHLQLVQMGIHGPVTEEQREALDRIDRAQRHLLALINDVLSFAKIESGRVQYDVRETDLRDVVADLAPMIEPQLAAKGLVYDVRLPEEEARVWADAEKLRQILLNLLSNAVKFTPAGGRIAVDVRTRVAGPGADPTRVYLRVEDTGIGIPREKHEAIFDPFVQAHAGLTRQHEGTGLGLAISRDLARGMGGDLRVRSAEGRGAVFTVSLRRCGLAPGRA